MSKIEILNEICTNLLKNLVTSSKRSDNNVHVDMLAKAAIRLKNADKENDALIIRHKSSTSNFCGAVSYFLLRK